MKKLDGADFPGRGKLMIPNHLTFFDTTLRDGEQSPGCSMTTQEKLTMAHALEDLGVDIIEAGFAMASEGDFAAIATITQAVRKPRIASLARAKAEDIEMAARALQFAERARIHVFLASSDLHLEYKLKMGRSEALDLCGESVRLACSLCNDVEFSPEDATRSDRDFLVEMVGIAVDAGATTINMPDTVGYTTPEEYGQMFREVRERIPAIDEKGVVLSSHCHDDLGLAVANSLAAVQNGARQVECTINGIGERAGNAALEEIAAALYVRADRFGVTSNIKLDQLYPTSEVLGQLITFRPSPNKAVVGANAFAHESGIHQHGVLANPLCYEIMTPQLVGVSKTHLVLGKHSGRAALRHRLEQLGFTVTSRGIAARLLPICSPGRPQEKHLRPGSGRASARQYSRAAAGAGLGAGLTKAEAGDQGIKSNKQAHDAHGSS